MSVPTIAYIRNQANRLYERLSNDPGASVTNQDLQALVLLIADLAGFVDLDSQNIEVS